MIWVEEAPGAGPAGREAAQLPQNLVPGGFSAWHLGQRTWFLIPLAEG
jgi:hypothetical protein